MSSRVALFRRAFDRRKLLLEPLEQRLLLSLVNSAIDSTQQQVLEDGLTGLVDWAEGLDDHGLMAQVLPVTGLPAGYSLDTDDVLDQGLLAPVVAYFASDPDPTTDELVAALSGLSQTIGDLTITVNPSSVSGGLDAGANEFVFNLVFQAQRSHSTGVSLGPNGDYLGLSFDPTITIDGTSDLAFDFCFGMDLTGGLTDEQAFFIRVNDLDVGVDSSATLPSSGDMHVGFFDAQLTGGSMSLSADLDVGLPGGTITLEDLETTELDDLVAYTPSGSASGNVTLTASSWGGFTPPSSSSVSFTSANPFDAPSLSYTGMDELLNFTHLSSYSLLSVFEQLGTWLNQLRGTSVLDTGLWLAAGTDLGDVLNLGGAVADHDFGLVGDLLDSSEVPTFGSAQTLATQLETVLGLPSGTINASYDDVTNELTYHLILDETFVDTELAFGIDLDLSPVAAIESASMVDVSAGATLEFTFGVDLSGLVAVLEASSDGPTNGRLTEDAVFDLKVGGAAAVGVTVTKTSTDDNVDLDDLADDFNTALAAAGLGSRVAASRSGNRIRLSTQGIDTPALLQLDADSENAIIDEVGFEDGQFAADSIAAHAFIENATIEGTATATATTPDSLINASATLGFIDVDVVDGTGTATASVALELKEPGAGTPGGRLTLPELFSGLSAGITTIVADPTIDGSLNVTLPLTATILGTPVSGSPELVIAWADITTGSPDLTFNGADELLRFEHFDSDDLIGALSDLADYLVGLEDYEFMQQKIPGLDKSLGEIAGYAATFLNYVDNFEENAAASLDELESALETAFGLNPSLLDLELVEGGDVLRVDFGLGESIGKQYPLNLDLEDLGLDVGNLVELGTTGQLAVDLGIDFSLDFGIDLTDPMDPRPFIYETTGLDFTALVVGDDIEFTAAIGPLGVFITQGSFLIDGDGNPATTTDAAALSVGLTDNNPGTTDGKIYLSDLDVATHTGIELTGQLNTVLPVYFPTQSSYLGDVELSITDLGDAENTTTFDAPDLQTTFDSFDLLNNLGAVLDGIDFLLAGVRDVLGSDVFNTKLPLIGDSLGEAATFIEDIRTGTLADLRAEFGALGNDTVLMLQNAIFDALGPDGLDWLKDQNSSGTVTIDDVIVTATDTDGDLQDDDQVDVQVLLGQDLALVDVPIDFDIGIPALGLDVEGDIKLMLGFDWHVAFGISRDYGFYFDTSAADELALTLSATTPDLSARGDLVFLQLDVRDEDADDNPNNQNVDVDEDGKMPSIFAAALTIDILDPIDDPGDPNDDDKLRFADFTNSEFNLANLLDASIDGGADVNLDFVVSFDGDARFPSIEADFELDWAFNVTDPDLTGQVPTIAFNNIRLNIGSFLSDFAEPALSQIRQYTAPLDPIIDFLNSPTPLLEDFGIDVTPLQLAAIFGPSEVGYIQAAADVIALINSIPIIDGQVYVPLGNFDLGTVDPRAEEDLTEVDPNGTTTDPINLLQSISPETSTFVNDSILAGISFPIIESPGNVFKLLLGQDVDLFLFDMPKLAVNFPFPPIKIGPLWPPIPIFAAFGGSIEAGLDVKFGYDTHGLNEFRETGDYWDIFSGFFVSDRVNADGTGADVPEAYLKGEVYAGIELGLWIIAAGISGGLELDIYADLNDPDNDGKVHMDELLANLERGLLVAFDVSGELKAKLEVYVELLFKRWDYTIAEYTITTFELTPDQIYQDRMPSNNSRDVSSDLGVGPGQHLDGLGIESAGDEDWYKFELLRTDSVDVDIRYSHALGNVDLEVYDSTGVNLLGESKTDRDRDVVSLVDAPAGTYYIHVTGDAMNNYDLAIEPGETSDTRVIYVAPASDEPVFDPANLSNRYWNYYTYEPGNDDNTGLVYRKPKATLTSVLATYDLGPNDLVVFDTGQHVGGATITSGDGGATYVGSIAGASMTSLNINDSDDSLIYNLTFTGGATGVTILGDGSNDAEGNTIRNCTFSDSATGLRVESTRPNLIENNTFEGDGTTGVYFDEGVTSVLRQNDVSGYTTGFYCDSRAADVHDNDFHGNTIGMSTLVGVLGPNNPAPIGSPTSREPNRVWGNETGVLVPEGAIDAVVRFNHVYGNTEVGIESLAYDSQIIANDVENNPIGIRGAYQIGPANWGGELYNLIHGNLIGMYALPGAEVRYNRVYANQTGIQVEGNTQVHHNLIYRNTQKGLLLDAAYNVDIINNTIYADAGDGIQLTGGVINVDVRNNIVYTTSGHGLNVASDSQYGYTSDYNNYFTGGSGFVAFQGKSFADLYDWQVEAESDLHSIGYTAVDTTLDNPRFENLGIDDYRLQTGSTSIDAGDPTTDYDDEPGPNGNRINLGAYGNTPLAAESDDSWLRLTYPRFYVDLIPTWTYPITWESYNLAAGTDVDVDLYEVGVGKVADVAVVSAAAGGTTWTPSLFVAGDNAKRYRLQLTTVAPTPPGPVVPDSPLVVQSREAFAIPNFSPDDPNTFYVDDSSNTNDQYTPSAVGDNRNTGLTPSDPKVVIRSLVLSYPMGAGDVVHVDNGDYVHAVNLNLSGAPLAFDPRMNQVDQTLITGPTTEGTIATIDRANQYAGSKAIDMIGSPGMTLEYLTIVNAQIGVHARDGSPNFTGRELTISNHSLDGLAIANNSDTVLLDEMTVFTNGRHGIFIDGLLVSLTNAHVYQNTQIGIALRGSGPAVVDTCDVHNNGSGIEITNPDPSMALVGNANLTLSLGNLVHNNANNGITASGYVLVAGNSVYENGNIGIRLDDGADAVLNVCRTHVTGISAEGSTSHIAENRSFNNTETGIIASFDSFVERNVTYSNDVFGIHAINFSGIIEHNLVYETGYNSINVEGPGIDAKLINNTVYEPCPYEEEEETSVEFIWEWDLFMESLDSMTMFAAMTSGDTSVVFGEPVGLLYSGTFNLGPGGGLGALTTDPVPFEPIDEQWLIPYEVTTDGLFALEPTPLGNMEIHFTTAQGQIVVQNVDGFLVGSASFELCVEFYFPDEEITLTSDPILMATEFGPSNGYGAFDVLQTAVPLGPFNLMDMIALSMDEMPWGHWQLFGAMPTPGEEPQHPGTRCAEIGIIVQNQSSYVLLRNNVVYVEGCGMMPPGQYSHEIIVTADSTTKWDSDFNAWVATGGHTGQWAGVEAPSLVPWQLLSGDDAFAIDPPWQTVWVDPDGLDNFLGYQGIGAGDGRDDNLHLRSPYSEVAQGALAPVEDVGGTDLPMMLPVVWQSDPIPKLADLSPAVDLGDPAYDFSQEPTFTLMPVENGDFINAGCYGNTQQASATQPQFVHMVYPIGLEELVEGNTYDIQWRSQDYSNSVTIELWHGSVSSGYWEYTIKSGALNTGMYTWTVPSGIITTASDYVVVVRRDDDGSVGESRLQLAVSPWDSVAPTVLDALPRIVETQQQINIALPQIVLTFSEAMNATAASNPVNYDLRGDGADGVFFTGDDLVISVMPAYMPGPHDGAPSTVVLNIGSVGLNIEDLYQLTAYNTITDLGGNSLAADGIPVNDYVRQFTIDFTNPTVDVAAVATNPRNTPVTQISIVFDEEVRGLGLADLRLTRDGGPNLLAGEQIIPFGDGVTWTIPNLEDLTSEDGYYVLQLIPANSQIRDLAGNPLLVGDAIDWIMDTEGPRVSVVGLDGYEPLPVGTDQLTLQFSEPVASFGASNLSLARIGGSTVTPSQVLLAPDRLSATVSFAGSLLPGNYKLSVYDSVADDAGNALDGNANRLADDPTDHFLTALTVAAIPGDANRDNAVDADDALILAEHWGLSGMGWTEGDFTGDGAVTAADAAILAANWGASVAEESEPTVDPADPIPAKPLVGPVPSAPRGAARRPITPPPGRASSAAARPPAVSESAPAAHDAVLAEEQYGPQVGLTTLERQQLAWSFTQTQWRNRDHDDKTEDKTALAVDLLLAKR